MRFTLPLGAALQFCFSLLASHSALAGAASEEILGKMDYALPARPAAEEPALPIVKIAPNPVYTPLATDEAGNPTPLLSQLENDNDLWSRVRGGFGLGELNSPLVRQQELYYAKRPEYVKRIVERGSRYLYYIVSEVERRGMPTEIALLPMIESAFNPKAESPAAASGIWQFIPSTGKHFGLERTWWYDGRRDVVAATDAALDYLQTLYNMFGDWQLALAAYNWGEGSVSRAIAKAKRAGIENPTYATINMPNETRNYVPKLMAVRNILANPGQFGIDIPPLANKPYFETVRTGRHIDINLIAQLAGITLDELLNLNPGLKRPVFAYKDNRQLVLPAERAADFKSNLAQYDKPLLSWQPYVTRRGESLDALAGKFNISAEELKRVNELPLRDKVARGQTILVPLAGGFDVSARQTIAALLAAPAKDSTAAAPPAATQAAVASKASAREESNPPGVHRVVRGETAYSIAKRYGLTPSELMKLNGLRHHRVHLGQTLKVSADDGDSPATTAKNAKDKTGKDKSGKKEHAGKADKSKTSAKAAETYPVKRGDTVASIARKLKMNEAELRRLNGLSAKTRLRPGSQLKLPD